MKILLTGASGQLGRELRPQFESLGAVVGADRDVLPGDTATLQMDLGQRAEVEKLLASLQPDIIVNAAAFTAVDAAEDHPETAFLLNGELPEWLARWSAANNGFLVHYSTDYVFPGTADRPYTADDRPGPLNVYGASKLAGEDAVRKSGCRHLIVRTSWVYSGHGNNFLLTMLRLAAERPSLGVVNDQVGCPTWARNLAAVSRQMLDRALSENDGENLSGLYHYCDGGVVSWYDFALSIFRSAKSTGLLEKLPQVSEVGSDDFPQKAERPRYSVLDVSATLSTFGIQRPGLEESVRACLEGVAKDG